MITVECSPSYDSHLRLWNLDLLMAHRSPVITSKPAPISLLHSQTILLHSQIMSSKPLPRVRLSLSAHESPLRKGLYTIWVTVSVKGAVEAIYKYDLSLLGSTSLSPNRKTSEPYQLPRSRSLQDDARISYAGHTVLAAFDSEILSLCGPKSHSKTKIPLIRKMGRRYFWQKEIFGSKHGPRNHVISLPNFGSDRHSPMQLSIYNRALIFRQEGRIVISYYD
ncbi:hypothetical protein L208DRAFT_457389 [Tricholoma matsutake]|nr:hypothetical protein L208DRAFT_457389 [Tricholoma matsutake 945]